VIVTFPAARVMDALPAIEVDEDPARAGRILTFSRQGTTILEGAVHLLVFLVYLVLIFSP
jgi:hypothetical protein